MSNFIKEYFRRKRILGSAKAQTGHFTNLKNVESVSFAYALHSEADISDVMKMKTDLESRMNEIIKEENLDLFMLLVTDIVNSNSQVIALGNSASLVEKAYGVKLENNTALLKGVVSRKKQVVPIMTENA